MKKIIHGDSLVEMASLEPASIDLVLTDPPYNISKPSNFHTMKTGARTVDFGDWDKNFDQLAWIDGMAPLVKTGGSVVIFNALENMGDIKRRLESNGFDYKEFITWKKTNPMPRNRDRLYVTARETAIWAVKGRGWAFNRQRDNYENGFFEYPTVHHSRRFHPTQKPLELFEDLIQIHSDKGDVVLDPFLGSGTTAVAAERLGRGFIGIELDEEYAEISRKRVKDERGGRLDD